MDYEAYLERLWKANPEIHNILNISNDIETARDGLYTYLEKAERKIFDVDNDLHILEKATVREEIRVFKSVIGKLNRVSKRLVHEKGREPTNEEIAKKMELPVSKVQKIKKIAQVQLSLETRIGEGEGSHLKDFIEDKDALSPRDEVMHTNLKEKIEEALKANTQREANVLKMRFGLGNGMEHTLEEVWQQYKVTRERIRQIQEKAIRKFEHSRHRRKLESFMK